MHPGRVGNGHFSESKHAHPLLISCDKAASLDAATVNMLDFNAPEQTTTSRSTRLSAIAFKLSPWVIGMSGEALGYACTARSPRASRKSSTFGVEVGPSAPDSFKVAGYVVRHL